MAKICVSDEHGCNDCRHYMFEIEYKEYCCYAKPNKFGEVEWEPKEEEDNNQ